MRRVKLDNLDILDRLDKMDKFRPLFLSIVSILSSLSIPVHFVLNSSCGNQPRTDIRITFDSIPAKPIPAIGVKMITETITYECKGVALKGHIVYSGEASAKRPAVIVAHAWRGQDDFARERAHELAELGYVGFAADLYGDGKTAQTDEEALKLMLPLFLDRSLLRERINAAFDVLKSHPYVDAAEIGAIGFCFGGLTVIELLRSGADVAGVVSFHGVLGDKLGEHKATLAPNAKKIEGSLLILHGHDDPLSSAEDICHIQDEFTLAKVDWQMNIYGHTMHAFTNPQAHDLKNGLVFEAIANMRSWREMCNFFEEIFP